MCVDRDSHFTFLQGFAAGALAMLAALPGATARGEDAVDPTPAVVWPSGPLDLVLAFPGPVEDAWANHLVGKTIPYFEPGDRRSPGPVLGNLRIAGITRLDDGRTLRLATDPHPRMARYELPAAGSGKQKSVIAYDLAGVEAAWYEGKQPDGAGEPEWKGWWPQFDADRSRRQTQGSVLHERGFALMDKPGRLVLSGQLLLPRGAWILRIDASGPISEASAGDEPVAENGAANPRRVEFSITAKGEPLFLTLTVKTGGAVQPLAVSATAALEAGGPRDFKPLSREWVMAPWAPVATGAAAAPVTIPDLSTGDPRCGEAVFFSEQAKCSQCHAYRGRGGEIGPDLSDVGRKGKPEIYRSIAAPSAEIAADFVPYTVAAVDGRVFAGVLRAEGASAVRVTDTNARTTILRRDEIDQIRPSATSIMPVGLAGALGEDKLRDLIAFLARPAP